MIQVGVVKPTTPKTIVATPIAAPPKDNI